MKDYRVEVKVKNNYLFRLMESYGLSSAAELSRASGVAQTAIGKILNLKAPALTKTGKETATAQTLCDFFACSVYDLFPPQHINDPLQINYGAIEANMAELTSSNLLAGGTDPLQIVSDGDAVDLVAAAVGTLTNREQTVVNARFGLNGEEEKTLAQIGKELGDHLKDSDCKVSGYNLVKGFVNLEMDNDFWSTKLSEITADKSYGVQKKSGEKVLVEYSSPNTNKPLHLGHIRNILLGWSCAHILEANGAEANEVLGALANGAKENLGAVANEVEANGVLGAAALICFNQNQNQK